MSAGTAADGGTYRSGLAMRPTIAQAPSSTTRIATLISNICLFIGSPRTAGTHADSPCLRLRLALRPRDVLRLALFIHKLASHGGRSRRLALPAAAARTTAP